MTLASAPIHGFEEAPCQDEGCGFCIMLRARFQAGGSVIPSPVVVNTPHSPGALAAWRGLRRGAEGWHPEVRKKKTTIKELLRQEKRMESAIRGWMIEQREWLGAHLDTLVQEPDLIDTLDWASWESRFTIATQDSTESVLSLGGEDSKTELKGPTTKPTGTAARRTIEPAVESTWSVQSKEAQQWIVDHGLDLAKGLNDTTKARMKQILVNGQRLGLPIDKMRSSMQRQFTDMSTWRARMIAQTETIRAYSEGSQQVYKGAGVKNKQWLDGQAGADGICQGLDGEVVGIDEFFSDGSFGPPAHPGCRCAIRAVMDNPKKNLLSEESKIAGNTDFETALAFDRNGNIIFRKNGVKDQVEFTKAEVEKMRNSPLFTHNHPGGGSLSPQDVHFATGVNINEMRAVGQDYAYSIAHTGQRWPEWEKLNREIQHWNQVVRTEFTKAVNAGTMHPKNAEFLHWHEVWTRLSNAPTYKNIIKYTRSRRV